MKYLQIVNASVIVFATSMALILAVVCVLYGTQLSHQPQLRTQLPSLLLVTGLFTALGAAAGAAFAAHRRHWAVRWLVQVLPALPAAGLALFLASLR